MKSKVINYVSDEDKLQEASAVILKIIKNNFDDDELERLIAMRQRWVVDKILNKIYEDYLKLERP